MDKISQADVVAKYDSLPVLIYRYGKDECVVRYLTNQGRKKNKELFKVKTEDLRVN